jgi:predicted XRE-type DNA-binding protein
MSIPLDRLYHFIDNIAKKIYGDRVIIYRFFPYGSKNIINLAPLESYRGSNDHSEWANRTRFPAVYCNDQEPLDYEFYRLNPKHRPKDHVLTRLVELSNKNLNHRQTIFEKGLLVHSEKRSSNLEKYFQDNELIAVYYWSHALIARDWFRYAEHVKQQKQVNKTFLIYNRAWAGTREYRLKFAEILINIGLQDFCQTTVNPIEPELKIHYDTHQFKNPAWRPQLVLENFFPTSDAQSFYSADFDLADYEATDIEIVLETLFDDGRLHLTEKSLRPIACAQPFILAGTCGSLEYLRSYGFKTFSDVWDETYDTIEDPQERMCAITDLMKQIANWAPRVRERKLTEAQAITEHNRQHFFSQEFFSQVVNELTTNMTRAFEELDHCNNYTAWYEQWKALSTHPELIEFLNTNQDSHKPTATELDFVLKLVENKLS